MDEEVVECNAAVGWIMNGWIPYRESLYRESYNSIVYVIFFNIVKRNHEWVDEEVNEWNAAVDWIMNGWMKKLMNAIIQFYCICNIL